MIRGILHLEGLAGLSFPSSAELDLGKVGGLEHKHQRRPGILEPLSETTHPNS